MEDLNFGEVPVNASPRSSKRFPSRFFVLIIVIIVLALIVFGISQLFFSKEETNKKENVTTTTTVAITTTTEPEATKAAEVTTTKGTEKTTTTTTKAGAGTLDKSKVSIEIQNGSGETGVASTMSTYLKNLGYTISSTGNAENFDYEGVTIQTKAEFKNYIATLKKDLTPDYIVSASSSDLLDSSTADILVIVGK
jgi:hypothetical protein